MKKILLTMAATFATIVVFGQNVQIHYDFGHILYNKGENNLSSRCPLTTTVEMFKPDKWGSTFFFVDMDYGKNNNSLDVRGAYWEISRELKFWEMPLSVHLEYNGGMNSFLSFDSAYLFGATWTFANSDFSKTFSITPSYKFIKGNVSPHNFQLTGVWNLSFFDSKLSVSGFADFWREKRPWQNTEFIFLSEPQIWYNLNTIDCMKDVNLSVGGEVELSYNMYGNKFYAIPTLALKWTF